MTVLQHDGVRDSFPRSGRMRVQMRNGCCGLLIALLLSLVATPAGAQAWSRGIQDLPISTGECMQRAAYGLQAEGYSIRGRGDGYIGGGKGIHTAVITCNAGPGGGTSVNIVAVSCGAQDGDVPGGERVRLQQRMQNAASGGGIGDWRPAGTGDCSGHDTGSSQGPNPDPSRCNASTAGLTAICWGNWCTYKNIRAASCTGGGSPGNMYTCGAAGSPPGGGGASSGGGIGDWRPAGTGDCSGHDTGSSQGPNPDPSRCNASTAGLTAICWGNWCTYKNIRAASCTGGGSPGNMYTCGAAGSPPGGGGARAEAVSGTGGPRVRATAAVMIRGVPRGRIRTPAGAMHRPRG